MADIFDLNEPVSTQSVLYSPESTTESTIENNEFEEMLCETLEVLEEPASKEVILRMLSATTDRTVISIVNEVDSVIEKLMTSDRLKKHDGKYTLKKQSDIGNAN